MRLTTAPISRQKIAVFGFAVDIIVSKDCPYCADCHSAQECYTMLPHTRPSRSSIDYDCYIASQGRRSPRSGTWLADRGVLPGRALAMQYQLVGVN